jgi:FlaA1/EpsC-like NDP-sugar epimerase
MPDSNTDTPPKNKIQSPAETAKPPAALLRFRRPLIIVAHLIAFAASLLLSFLVAHNMQFRRDWLVNKYPLMLFFFILIKLPVFGLFGQYRGWWRYVGISDLMGILRASLVSTLVIVSLWSALLFAPTHVRQTMENITNVGQGIFMADLFMTVLVLSGFRMIVRLYHEEFRTVESGRLKRFLIVGAGNAGEALLREIHRMPVAQYDVVGFIDDDPAKQRTNIHGIPILGAVEQLPEICKQRNIDEIAVAIPSASHHQLRRVIQVCEGTKSRFRTVPSVTDIASGRFRVSQIRDVDISDLLGREVVQLDLDLIEAFIGDKTVLVTGAGGSIGSEMCRQVGKFGPKMLLLVEQAENPLFYVERQLQKQFPNLSTRATICNITDRTRVQEIFEKYRPDVVIHAAAHKHVPLMELNPGRPQTRPADGA